MVIPHQRTCAVVSSLKQFVCQEGKKTEDQVRRDARQNELDCVEKNTQLRADVTECFIVLMICSTCFGNFYAHHKEL